MKKHRVLNIICGMMIAFLTALLLFSVTANRMISDRSLYRQAAQDSVPERMTRFETSVRQLAADVHFAPETALAFYNEERVRGIANDRADWFLAVLSGAVTTPPDVSAPGLTEAIMEDELFDGNRHIARDEGAYEVERLAGRAFLPLRASLITKLLSSVQDRIGVIGRVRRLAGYLPWALLIVILILSGAQLTLGSKNLPDGFAWLFASYTAGGLCGAALAIPALRLRIPALIGEVSPVLAKEITQIQSAVLTRHLLLSGCILLISAVLFVLFWRKTGDKSK